MTQIKKSVKMSEMDMFMCHKKLLKSNKKFYLIIGFVLLLFLILHIGRKTADSNSQSNQQSGIVLDVMTFNIPGGPPGGGMLNVNSVNAAVAEIEKQIAIIKEAVEEVELFSSRSSIGGNGRGGQQSDGQIDVGGLNGGEKGGQLGGGDMQAMMEQMWKSNEVVQSSAQSIADQVLVLKGNKAQTEFQVEISELQGIAASATDEDAEATVKMVQGIIETRQRKFSEITKRVGTGIASGIPWGTRGDMIGDRGGGSDGEQGGTRSSWEGRFLIVCEILRNYDIDFIGFQEITRQQIDQIREVLPQYGELGVARDDGQTRGEYCAILYRTDRFKISEEESGTFWLSETPEVPGSRSWNTSFIRICTWARFTEINSGNSFYFYNTHLDVDSQWAREEGALLIFDRIKKRTHKEPYFLTGDFNANELEQTITYIKGITPLTRQNGEQVDNTIPMVDTFRVLYPDRKDVRTRHDWTFNREGDKIDYVFASPDIKVLKAEIVYYNKDGKYPSDHYPVMATINIPAN